MKTETHTLSQKDSIPKTVLVVDDMESIRDLVVAMLQARDVAAIAVTNAREAIETCRNVAVDCVLLDIKMPGDLDGFDAFEMIKAINPAIRVIFVTGSAFDDEMENYISRADGYIAKPFDLTEFDRILFGD